MPDLLPIPSDKKHRNVPPASLSLMQQGKGRKTRDEKLESTFKVGSN